MMTVKLKKSASFLFICFSFVFEFYSDIFAMLKQM